MFSESGGKNIKIMPEALLLKCMVLASMLILVWNLRHILNYRDTNY